MGNKQMTFLSLMFTVAFAAEILQLKQTIFDLKKGLRDFLPKFDEIDFEIRCAKLDLKRSEDHYQRMSRGHAPSHWTSSARREFDEDRKKLADFEDQKSRITREKQQTKELLERAEKALEVQKLILKANETFSNDLKRKILEFLDS